MFEHVIVYLNDDSPCNEPEIIKCRTWDEVEEHLLEMLADIADFDIMDEYLDYVGSEAKSDWDFEPVSVNEWLKDRMSDNSWLHDMGIWIE